jgi:hypothetical protein
LLQVVEAAVALVQAPVLEAGEPVEQYTDQLVLLLEYHILS